MMTNLLINQRLKKFLSEDLKAFFPKCGRMFLLTFRGFRDDRCQLRASALSLYSLLSVVPVMAMAFGIAKGFGFEKMLEKQLLEKIPGQEESLLHIIDFARTLLENTKGGVIAGIGVVFLFWSAIKVLSNVESSFNHIWKVQESRRIDRKFSDYLSIILIAPLLVIMASSLSVFITTQVTLITENTKLLEVFSPLILSSLKLLPYGLIWILFSFLYIFMPNTKVRVVSGVFGGIIAGTVYQLVQVGYIYFQVGLSNYNAIYGSFAALPFFILWLQLSWFVVLFGAEIAFYHQQGETYRYNHLYSTLAPSLKKLLALRISHLVVVHFSQGTTPVTTNQIAHTLGLSSLLLHPILDELVQGELLSRIPGNDNRELAYQPAKTVNLITVKSVIDALEFQGEQELPYIQTKDTELFSEILQQFDNALEQSPANLLLKDLSEEYCSE